MLRDAIDRRREDDMGPGVSPLVSIDYAQVDVAVGGGGRDRLDLLDVEIIVDCV